MLPDILEVAKQHNLSFNPKTYGRKQTTSKCPFCFEDSLPRKRKKYYLSLNIQDMLFRCWYCQEQGGVFRFMSLLEGRSENEIIAEFRKKNGSRYRLHPAEKLTSSQLKLIGLPKPYWVETRKIDSEQYKKLRIYVIKAWEQFVLNEVKGAYRHLYLGVITGTYSEQLLFIKRREQIIGEPLLEKAVGILSCKCRPAWCRNAESLVLEICFPKQDHLADGDSERKSV